MRRVRRLQLTAPSAALGRRAQLLLEDALRTASLPGAEEARLWLVRSLHLGVIDSRLSSAQLARGIEERIRQKGLICCAGADPAAAEADVVVFPSALDASIALALRLGRGEPVRGWYWPLAVPAYRPGAAAAEALRALLWASAELPGAAAASAAWLEAVVEAGAADPLLASLSAAQAEGLLRLGGWEPPVTPAVLDLEPLPLPFPLPRAWRPVLGRWLPRWGADDPRGLWLVAMALVARQPARLGSARVLRQARGGLRAEAQLLSAARTPPRASASDRTVEARASQRGQSAISSAAMSQPAAPAPAPSPGRAIPGRDAAASSGEPPFPLPGGREGRDPAANPAVASSLAAPSGARRGPEELCSQAAGLAFLVTVLRLEGIEIWLARHPVLLDADWPRWLLRGLADGLAVPPSDPLRDALELQTLAPAGESPGDSTGAPFADRAVLAAVSRHWRRRLRRWCQQPGRLSLRELVRRPGVVVASRTHLELWFQLRQVEIRVRRHGLDLDPGWVFWLGRVIRFHYEQRGPADAEG